MARLPLHGLSEEISTFSFPFIGGMPFVDTAQVVVNFGSAPRWSGVSLTLNKYLQMPVLLHSSRATIVSTGELETPLPLTRCWFERAVEDWFRGPFLIGRAGIAADLIVVCAYGEL